MQRVMVSACLLGVGCRFDGRSKTNPEFIGTLKAECVIPICPEQLGGLPTPREAASLQGGDGADVLRGRAKVVTVSGRDVTEQFIRGAHEALGLARRLSVRKAYFKAKSPSCGCGRVYLGESLKPGYGVCAALLRENGIEVSEVE
jgi:uncharacterized protein YbbK (DUF523 family)